MESNYLTQLANLNPEGTKQDADAPYSFLEWKMRLPSIIEKDAVFHYNRYLIEWFEDRSNNAQVSQKFILRQKYIYLLDQLQLFFSTDEKNKWYSYVNLADEKELLVAIPYFAKKLKNIALYYLKLRQKLKDTKVKYNNIGTKQGIEHEIYNFILETFSTNNQELAPDVLNTIPNLNDIKETFSVQIEELYDDHQYFDISPTQPLSGYFDVFNKPTADFYATKGLVLSSDEWIFNSFNVPVTSNFDSFITNLTGVLFEQTDSDLLQQFISRYIAENKYTLTYDPEKSTAVEIQTYNIPITQGNNYFYYPFGTTDNSINNPEQMDVIDLSSVNVLQGNAGTSLADSDTIFVKVGSTIKAAWLRYVEFDELNKTIKAALRKDTTTSFIYPFPGYGLSSEDIEWTGPGFETNLEYNFLTKANKASVNNAYWGQILPPDSTTPIMLNNSTLVNYGATPHVNPDFADKLYIRAERDEDVTKPRKEVDGAWLYRFTKSAIPISPIQENKFLWPYQLFYDGEIPHYVKNLSLSGICNPVPIEDFDKTNFIAGATFNEADKIYRLQKPGDPIEKAVECSWLSGSEIVYNPTSYGNAWPSHQFVKQHGLNALFPPGQTVRFVWTGEITPLNRVFKHVPHRRDCPFLTQMPAVSAYDWQKCTCKAVYHSPVGHNKDSFEAGNMLADVIVEDNVASIEEFNFSSWRDRSGNNANYSRKFAWFKTKKGSGWLPGKWVSDIFTEVPDQNTNVIKVKEYAPFQLMPGKAYIYRRAGGAYDDISFPPYSKTYPFQGGRTKWIAAKYIPGEGWVSADVESKMTFVPGSLLKYERQPYTTAYVLSATYTENQNENRGSAWSTWDWMPLKCIGGEPNKTTISIPLYPKPIGYTGPNQYPPPGCGPFDVTPKIWTVTLHADPSSGRPHEQKQEITGFDSVTFVPPSTGIYSIKLHALSGYDTVEYVDGQLTNVKRTKDVFYGDEPTTYEDGSSQSFIPHITVVPQFSQVDTPIPILLPSNGFVLEHKLKGWNYTSRNFTPADDGTSDGARPYWAVLDTKKTASTRLKGIYSWGYVDEYIDDYIPNAAPVLSPLNLEYGKIVEYQRRGASYLWEQPIKYQQYVGQARWSRIYTSFTSFSNLSSIYQIKRNIDPVAVALKEPTDIRLSNMINGAPVEVYYYALSNFVWPVTSVVVKELEQPKPEEYINSYIPYGNPSNRFYPTIATVPVIQDVYDIKKVGGYMLPQNLGASQFINKNYTVKLKTSELSGVFVVENTSLHVGGRGRSKQDHDSLYTWTEDNDWVKEPFVMGNLGGAVKKSLTKPYQTFVPYYSNDDEKALGLIRPNAKFSPWGGKNDKEWVDSTYQPASFTGVRDLSAWVNFQAIKQDKKIVDCWCSDIYGNQYGLFKSEDLSPSERRDNTGELWTCLNTQLVSPATVSLSSVYNTLKAINGSPAWMNGNPKNDVFYSIDNFFNVLFLETSNEAIFVNIEYDYDSAQIQTTTDNLRFKLLNSNFVFENNWFLTKEKKVITLFTELTGGYFVPTLYEFDILTTTLKKIFPTDSETIANIHNSLSSKLNGFTTLRNTNNEAPHKNRATINFNRELDTYLISYSGKTNTSNQFLLDFTIKNDETLKLTKIDLFK